MEIWILKALKIHKQINQTDTEQIYFQYSSYILVIIYFTQVYNILFMCMYYVYIYICIYMGCMCGSVLYKIYST